MTEILPSCTCPCCEAVSYCLVDAQQGYCGRCHWWTGDDILGPAHLAEPCTARQQAAIAGVPAWRNDVIRG